jgi:hypothetical protein
MNALKRCDFYNNYRKWQIIYMRLFYVVMIRISVVDRDNNESIENKYNLSSSTLERILVKCDRLQSIPVTVSGLVVEPW